MRSLYILLSVFLLSLVSAETHVWNYTATYLNANPDGVFERRVVGFDNEWPLPTLRVKKGDRVNLYLTNGLHDANTTLHFHGMFLPGQNQMDGPEMITQCPIPPGETFLYNFTVANQTGTYWYHSHTAGQYGDGMRGVFIIEDDDFPYEYDEEVVLTLSEWYHDQSKSLIKSFLNRYNPTGAEPIPQNFLLNDTRNNSWHVQPNTTYLLRIVNIGGFVSQYLYMEDHEFEIVEVDGIYVEKNTTDLLYITVAQRYSVLLRTKPTADKNYALMHKADDTMLDTVPADLELNGTTYVMYDEDAKKPEQYYIDDLSARFDDFYLRPLSNTTLLPDADYTITIDVIMDNLGNGVNYAFFNNISFTPPKVPTLLTVLSAGSSAGNVSVYGSNTHTFVLQEDDVVDIVLNNLDTGTHPFHLHGHAFQVLSRAPAVDDSDPPVNFDPDHHEDFPEFPMMRDTLYVNPQSHFVIRFKANNPGVWYFHCHIEWHLEQGLALQLIEAPEAIVADPEQQITDYHKDICKKVGVDWEGNAAGNKKDFFDLRGENVQQKRLPAGFTARGIVALVFSCIAAVLGLIAIAFYGMADIKNIEQNVAKDLDVNFKDEEDDLEETSRDDEASSSLIANSRRD